MSRSTVQAGVVGASGYTGSELVRLLDKHPHFQCSYATSRTHQGKPLSALYPRLTSQVDIQLENPNINTIKELDLVFLAVPHGTSMEMIPELDNGKLQIIDLAGDYRISDRSVFEQAYQYEHTDAGRLSDFVYGLAEYNSEEISGSRLVSNPGCYVTSVLMALLPLSEQGWLSDAYTIFVDSKSGVSGAGRKPSESKLYMNVNNDVRPYNIGKHRHQYEMIHHLPDAPPLRFAPHVVAAERGIESAIYLQPISDCSIDDIRELFQQLSNNHPLLRYRPEPVGMKSVAETPFCDLTVAGDESGYVIISTIDNLLKGAASQAVQNANLINGFPSHTGLIPDDV